MRNSDEYIRFIEAKKILMSGQVRESEELFKKLADAGHSPSMFVLGNLYLENADLSEPSEGLIYLQKARECGHLYAFQKINLIKLSDPNTTIPNLFFLFLQQLVSGIAILFFSVTGIKSERVMY